MISRVLIISKLALGLFLISSLTGCFQAAELAAKYDSTNKNLKISLENSQNFSFTEDSSPEFTLVLSKETEMDTEVTWSITSSASGGSASQDFSQTSGVIVIPANTESFDFPLPVINDDVFENTKDFKWTFVDVSSHAKAEVQQLTFTLQDDEEIPKISFDLSSQSANEADRSINLAVSLDQEAEESILVNWSHSGSASLGDDFSIPVAGSFTISANQLNHNLELNIIDDIDVELPEEIIVSIDSVEMNGISLEVGSVDQNTVTIVDNDSLLTVSVDQKSSQSDPTLSLPIEFDVRFSKVINTSTFSTADISNSGSATGVVWEITNTGNDRDFTLKATAVASMGTIIPSIAAGIVTDTLLQENQVSTATDNEVSFNSELGFSTNTLSVAEDVSGGSLSIPVNLSAALSSALVVDYSVSSGTASNSETDFNLADGSLSFSAGSTSENIVLTINDDSLFEGDETLSISLSISSGSANIVNSPLSISITDNETAPELSFSTSSQHLSQRSPTTASFTITKTSYTENDITIPVNKTGSTTESGDHNLGSSLTMEGNVLSKTFSINILTDTEAQAVETLKINLGTPSIGSIGSISTHNIILTDPSLISSSICNDTSSTNSWGRLYDSGGIALNYSDSETCGFLIQPAGASSITLRAESINTHSTGDYIEVFDGASDSSSSLGVFSLSNFTEVSSTGGSMYIKWISDASNNSSGFDLQWESDGTLSFGLEKTTIQRDEAIYLEAYGGQEPYSFSLVSGSGSISGGRFSSSASGVNRLRVTDNLGATAEVDVQILDEDKLTLNKMCLNLSSNEALGQITDSGATTGNYADNEDCGFLIQVPGASYIELNTEVFQSYSALDYLEIYEGVDDTGSKIATFNLTNYENKITVNSNNVYLKWISSPTKSSTGFDIRWKSDGSIQLLSSAHQINLADSLTLSVAGGQGPYTYSIVSGLGSISGENYTASSTETGSVKLRVTDNLAQTDEIEIQVVDVNDLDSFKMCQIASSQMGFGSLVDSGGIVGNYADSEDCSFLIQPTGASSITITPSVFATASNVDYLDIYDGTNASGTFLARYFRSDFTKAITINSGNAFLVWHSSGSVNSTGFNLTWTSDAPIQLNLAKQQIDLGATVQMNAVGGQAPYTYSILSGSGSLSGNQYTASSTQSGTVVVRVTDNLANTAEASIQVVNNDNLEFLRMCHVASSSLGFGRLTDSGGTIDQYSDSENCGFLIQPTGASYITITPNVFHTYSNLDYLDIYSGTNNSGTKIARFYRTDFNKAITIQSSSVYLEWITSPGYTREGFDLSWSSDAAVQLNIAKNQINLSDTLNLYAVGGEAPYTYSIVSGSGSIAGNVYTASSTNTGSVKIRVTDNLAQTDEVIVQVVNDVDLELNRICHVPSSTDGFGRLTDSGGAIDHYSNNEDCGFLIQPTGASSITLTPESFTTYNSLDYLDIYSGTDSSGTKIGRFTRSDFNKSITINSGSVFLHWVTSTGQVSAGFDIRWSSDLPVQLNVAKHQIDLSESLELSPIGGQAPYTYSIVHGSGSFSGNQFIASSSVTGAVVIRVTDDLSQTDEVTIQVVAKEDLDLFRMCKSVSSTEAFGRIADSGGPADYYKNSEDCGFLIQPAGATSITLTANSFQTRDNYDYFEIYQGIDDSGTKVAKFSRTDFVKSITIPSGNVYLKWHSSSSNNSAGFDISWVSNTSVEFMLSKTQIDLGASIDLKAVGGQAPYSYSIQSGSGSISGNQFTASSIESGVVELKVVDNLSQEETIKIQVDRPDIYKPDKLCAASSSTDLIGKLTDLGGTQDITITVEIVVS